MCSVYKLPIFFSRTPINNRPNLKVRQTNYPIMQLSQLSEVVDKVAPTQAHLLRLDKGLSRTARVLQLQA